MGDLSKNFSKHEYACKCGCGENHTDEVLLDLNRRIQALRDIYDMPMVIISGHRCRKHNKAVGGSTTSRHMVDAADLRFAPLQGQRAPLLTDVFRRAVELFPRVGVYRNSPTYGSMHVDLAPTSNLYWTRDYYGGKGFIYYRNPTVLLGSLDNNWRKLVMAR